MAGDAKLKKSWFSKEKSLRVLRCISGNFVEVEVSTKRWFINQGPHKMALKAKYPIGILAHRLRMVIEPFKICWGGDYTPQSSFDKVIGSLEHIYIEKYRCSRFVHTYSLGDFFYIPVCLESCGRFVTNMKSMAYPLRESYCWWFINPKANHPGMSKNLANSGINELSTIIGVRRISSINHSKLYRSLVVHWLFCQDHSLQANVMLPIPHFFRLCFYTYTW